MKLLVIDAMRKTVSGFTVAFAATSRYPLAPECTSCPSIRIPQAAPGTFAPVANSWNNRSTSPNAERSFFTRSGLVNRAGAGNDDRDCAGIAVDEGPGNRTIVATAMALAIWFMALLGGGLMARYRASLLRDSMYIEATTSAGAIQKMPMT